MCFNSFRTLHQTEYCWLDIKTKDVHAVYVKRISFKIYRRIFTGKKNASEQFFGKKIDSDNLNHI